MTMLSNDAIQSSIVAYLKSVTTITARIVSTEIREDQWQGRDFVYPNIRVRMISNNPKEPHCGLSNISLSIMVFTEDASSHNADEIAGIINNAIHGKSFTSSGINLGLRTTNLVPAYRSDERTWRSEVLISGLAMTMI